MFLYLSSVVPSIWLLEFDKLDRRLELREERESGINTTQYIGMPNMMANSSDELSSIQTFGVSTLGKGQTLRRPTVRI